MIIDRLAFWALGAAALVVMPVGGHWIGKREGVREAETACVERWNKAASEASEKRRQVEQERFRALEIANENHRTELARARSAAAGARGERDRLRDELAARDRAAAEHPAAGGRADGAAVERELFGACADALQAVAGEADELAGQVKGLQRYVTNVVRPGEGQDP